MDRIKTVGAARRRHDRRRDRAPSRAGERHERAAARSTHFSFVAARRSRSATHPGMPDRPDPLLGPALLRTGRAPFNASGSSKQGRFVDRRAQRAVPRRGLDRPQVHSPRPVVGRLVCPLVLGVCRRLCLRGSPDHVSALSRPGTRPGIRPVIHGDQLEGLAPGRRLRRCSGGAIARRSVMLS